MKKNMSTRNKIKTPPLTLVSFIVLLVLTISCDNNVEDKDTEKPMVEFFYPLSCDTVFPGATFTLNALLTDNVELGAYSIDMHQNFDHHSHSTESDECELDEIKEAVNPFALMTQGDIPAGETSYELNVPIVIPSDVDKGDYHLELTVTDKEGWSSFKILSIKIN